MYGICSNTNNVSSILALAINKEIVKAKVNFLASNSYLHSNPFLDNYST